MWPKYSNRFPLAPWVGKRRSLRLAVPKRKSAVNKWKEV